MVSSASVIVGTYDFRIVVLSIVIAVLGSYAALDLAERLMAAAGSVRLAWLAGGATAQGIGIWSMHYTGMLAFQLPVRTMYDWPTALISFVPGVLGAAATLWIVTRARMGASRLAVGGILVGLGIVALHYIAMASMRFAGGMRFSPFIVILSIVFAIAFALLSLWLMFAFREGSHRQRWRRFGSASLMGAAISAMHYTGMAAATFIHTGAVPDLSHAVGISYLGILGIGAVAVAVSSASVATSIVDRLHQQNVLLRGSFDQLRALAARLRDVREEERTRVARDIHDQLGHALTSIKMDAASLIRELPQDQDGPVKRAESIVRVATETIQTVRNLATELRPAILDDLGPAAAIEWAMEQFRLRTRIICRVDLPETDLELDAASATALFRILQEALTNVARHAQASQVDVRLSSDDHTVLMEIHDNGVGFNEATLRRGSALGLFGMRERGVALGGTVTVEATPGGGTTVRVRIPHIPAEDLAGHDQNTDR